MLQENFKVENYSVKNANPLLIDTDILKKYALDAISKADKRGIQIDEVGVTGSCTEIGTNGEQICSVVRSGNVAYYVSRFDDKVQKDTPENYDCFHIHGCPSLFAGKIYKILVL